MAIVYYDFSAPTNGTGASPASPKNTYAVPAASDVVRIKRGNIWTRASQVSLNNDSLTFEAWANADGSDDPTLPKPEIRHTAASTFVWSFAGNGVNRIRNLIFRNCSSNPSGAVVGCGTVVATGNGASLEAEACEFYTTSHHAIRFSASGATATPIARIRHCVFDDIGEDAVYGGALNYEFAYNRVTRVSQRTETGDGVGFIGCNPTLAWVHHNYIDHRDIDFKHCIIIDGVDGSGKAIVEDNELLGTGTTIVNFSQVSGIARRNKITTEGIAFSSDVAGARYHANEITVLGYRFDATATIGLPAASGEVIGNTFIVQDRGGHLIETGTSTTGHIIKNNLVVGAGIFYKRGGGVTETKSNNGFVDTTSPYVTAALAPITVDVTDQVLTEAQAKLSNDFKPTSASPLRGAGTHLGYVRDLNLSQRANPPTIGAYDSATLKVTV